MAALLVWSGQGNPAAALLERLNPLMRLVEEHEKLLPVRAVWLAWLTLVQLAQGDVLALARARDRLLERLFHNGLRPDQDLPGFLRYSGQPASQRFRAVRQSLERLDELAQAWVKKNPALVAPPPPMAGYVDLIFSFGLARVGESAAANRLLERGRAVLPEAGDTHMVLFNAFEYRIRQALAGQPHAGPLPAEILDYVVEMAARSKETRNTGVSSDCPPYYAIERLRQQSSILEPHEKIDAYRHSKKQNTQLEQDLARLADVSNRQEVAQCLKQLLADVPRGSQSAHTRFLILNVGLEMAPRLGEKAAREILSQTLPTFDALPPPADGYLVERRAEFLERGLVVAGHFDHPEHIQPLLQRFRSLLQSPAGERQVAKLALLACRCFRSLRKLGMREEIHQLMNQWTAQLLQGQTVERLDVQRNDGHAALQALLHVAASWYYFGQDREAEPIVRRAHDALFDNEIATAWNRTEVARAYAAAVGAGPAEIAQSRLEELFQRLSGFQDTWTTKKYYSILQLNVIEAVVLAVASDDFTLGTVARRWLDDDEFLVRRRIHRDVRQLTTHA
jgi:hypothetical protein